MMDKTLTANQIPKNLWLDAARRLVVSQGRAQAAKRLLASAQDHGIDLQLMWGVIDESKPAPDRVLQTTLAVLGAGKTGMLFLSQIEQGNPDPIQTQIQCLSDSIAAAILGLRAYAPEHIGMAQTLLETDQIWAKQACEQAGMIHVGTLDYLRLSSKQIPKLSPPHSESQSAPCWPDGITIEPLRARSASERTHIHDEDRAALIKSLDDSYIDTFDCPELCGIRDMNDIVESHQSTGDFEPDHWLLIYKDGLPAGCCLLTPSHANNKNDVSLELVYLGIAPIARGLGLGKDVLSYGIQRLAQRFSITEVSCAVDRRNWPALRIYQSMGFETFDARMGFVAPIEPL